MKQLASAWFTVIQCTIAMNTVVLNREQKYILLYKKNKMHWLTFASARLGVKVEIGSRLTPDLRQSRQLMFWWRTGREEGQLRGMSLFPHHSPLLC